jgi:threonylcarbamoyladenosine tRNA methylthiotransferase MtaB
LLESAEFFRSINIGSNNMYINFQALGCRLNEAELETWANQFMQLGHQVTTDAAEADLVVFNSCAVTAQADRKSRQQIARLQRRNPAASLVVTGCHASLNPEAVKSTLGVDLVVDNHSKERLVEQALDLVGDSGDPVMGQIVESPNALLMRGRHRGFVKIQDGCRYRCTYCIVTIARGDERSRSEKDILEEINRLHQQGVQEIALTGVHVGGYGSDIESSLFHLLTLILEHSDIPRIRLASVEPWDLGPNFFELFDNPRLMPHMHLPIQSGSDTVLRRMARRCKTVEFARLVEQAREAIPLFNVTTDLIAGFPGETDEEWRQTMDFIASVGFGHMHIFPFSARAGTKAARLPEQVDGAIRKARSREMHALAAELKQHELSRHIGTQVEVLWEQQINADTGQWIGYTPHYHKIISADSSICAASISRVNVDSLSDDSTMLANSARQAQVHLAEIGHQTGQHGA